MSTKNRIKLAEDEKDDSVTPSDEIQHPGFSGDEDALSDQGDWQDSESDDEVADGRRLKSRKTLKRKRRATDSLHFGATLRSLLNTHAPSGLPLSLKPSVAHQKNDAKLESEARKVVLMERKDREERGRIRDVIGGWGGESERSLRKVAQRGVVKLFNTIQQSQLAAAVAEEEAKAARGTGKPSLPALSLSRRDKGKKKTMKADGPRGGNQSVADKEIFFDMIRSGGVVSKI